MKFNIDTHDFWYCYSWPVAFIFKFVPVPEKQFQPNFGGCCGKRKKKKAKTEENEITPEINEHSGESYIITIFSL